MERGPSLDAYRDRAQGYANPQQPPQSEGFLRSFLGLTASQKEYKQQKKPLIKKWTTDTWKIKKNVIDQKRLIKRHASEPGNDRITYEYQQLLKQYKVFTQDPKTAETELRRKMEDRRDKDLAKRNFEFHHEELKDLRENIKGRNSSGASIPPSLAA